MSLPHVQRVLDESKSIAEVSMIRFVTIFAVISLKHYYHYYVSLFFVHHYCWVMCIITVLHRILLVLHNNINQGPNLDVVVLAKLESARLKFAGQVT